jgi:hypothetical protein
MITGMDILKSGIAQRMPFTQRLHRLQQTQRVTTVRRGTDGRQSLQNALTQLRNHGRINQHEVDGWLNSNFGQEIINFLDKDYNTFRIYSLAAIVLKEPTDPHPMRIKEVILIRCELDGHNQLRSLIPQKRIRYINGHMRLQKAVGGGSSWLDIEKYD